MRRETIGEPDCPLFFRWTLINLGFAKVLWHAWVPGSTDLDPHDHPRSFVTVVLRGGYDDVDADGNVDVMRAPAVRYRPADHAHTTRTHDKGAWTLVFMGPVRREWGFIRGGRWWSARSYLDRFGGSFRCD